MKDVRRGTPLELRGFNPKDDVLAVMHATFRATARAMVDRDGSPTDPFMRAASKVSTRMGEKIAEFARECRERGLTYEETMAVADAMVRKAMDQ